MGYLSQKKKTATTKELLNISLLVILFCCIILFGWRSSSIGAFISHWLFQIYVYTIILSIYAIWCRFYGYSVCLASIAFVFFIFIGTGCNLFFDVKTAGTQSLNILYQPKSEYLDDIVLQMNKRQVDIAGLVARKGRNFSGNIGDYNQSVALSEKNLILTKHNINKSGEILLSENNSAGFIDISIQTERIVFIFLDFSLSPKHERNTALKNLAEFVNLQDIPVVIIGNFGVEAWSRDMLQFMDKTKLFVKNSVILSKGKYRFSPLTIPSINILAYKDFGIKDIYFLKAKKNKLRPMFIQLNY